MLFDFVEFFSRNHAVPPIAGSNLVRKIKNVLKKNTGMTSSTTSVSAYLALSGRFRIVAKRYRGLSTLRIDRDRQ